MIAIRSAVIAVALIFPVTYGAFAGQSLALGSGKTVQILGVGPMQSTQGWSALLLDYRTEIPLEDVPTLRKEADEIWNRFVFDVERAGYKTAFISAHGPTTGLIVKTGKTYKFLFEKKDGAWRTLEPKNTKLDREFVVQFVDRLDWAYKHNLMNVLLMYMATDWTLSVINPENHAENPFELDRKKYVGMTHSILSEATEGSRHRKITKITINDSGDIAKVDSRIKEELSAKDQKAISEETVTDHFRLKDKEMLWTSSQSKPEQLKKIDTE